MVIAIGFFWHRNKNGNEKNIQTDQRKNKKNVQKRSFTKNEIEEETTMSSLF